LTLDPAQIGLAFTAGLLGFMSPCALPMLPSYVAYYLNLEEDIGKVNRTLRAVEFAAATIIGFLTVFATLGLIPSLAVGMVSMSISIITPFIGVALIGLGVITFQGRILGNFPQVGLSAPRSTGTFSFYIYGVGYGLASLSCSFPIFLLVVLQSAVVGSPVETILLLAIYGLGAGALLVPITIAVSLSKDLMHRKLMSVLPHIRKLNAAVLIAAGFYMLLSSVIGR